MKGDHLNLVCGNPYEKAASTTRFVLPFAYQLSSLDKVKSADAREDLHFEQVSSILKQSDIDNFKNRQRYFTPETCKVLFKRAGWYRINANSDKNSHSRGWDDTQWAKGVNLFIKKQNEIRTIKTHLLPPTIVLFEQNNGLMSIARYSNTLQTGFLIIDLYFANPESDSNAPTIDDLLTINDKFRYFRPIYKEGQENYKEFLKKAPVTYRSVTNVTFFEHEEYDLNKKYADRWVNLLKYPVKIGNQYFRLIPEYNYEHLLEKLLIYSDDRAYVWSSAILNDGR